MGNCRRKYSLFENAVIWTSSKAWLQKLGQSRSNWAQYDKTWNVEHLMPYQTMAFLGQKYYCTIMEQPSSSYWVIHGPHPPRLGWQQPCLRMLQMLKCSTVPCRVVTQCDAVWRSVTWRVAPPSDTFYGQASMGWLQWAAFYGLASTGRLLWAAFYGLASMGWLLWAGF